MSARASVGRRRFLKTTGGLVIGFYVAPRRGLAALQAPAPPKLPDPNAFLRIGEDESVTVILAHSEMGQGVWTVLPMLLAEELGCDWAKVRVEGAPAAPVYAHPAFGAQMTGGSSSPWSELDRYRQAGALAREMLVRAAAEQWKVDPSACRVDSGYVVSGDKRLSFGTLAAAAQKQTPPAEVRLKDRKDWKIAGRPVKRLDSPEKVTGRAQFGMDVRLPGMLTAVLARPPLFGARAKSFDASATRQLAGVVDVVETPRGIAVVAKDTWSAIKGREALTVEWDEGGAEARGTAELLARYKDLARSGEGAVPAREKGDAAAALAGAAKTIEAEFEFPYLAHAAMEPLDATARFQDGVLEIWAGHQLPDLYQAVAAEIMGIDPAKVKLHVMTPGGFFGRRAVTDADVIVEVVSTLKATGAKAPVKVVWTREDDMRGGRYRPMYLHTLEAGLDAEGNPVAWQHRIVGQSILKGTPFEGMLVHHGVDETSVEGASTLPYAIPAMHVDLVTTNVGVPVLWWRSVGSTHTAYSTEVFLDELAQAVGRDPVEFRRALLRDQPRHLGVLNLAAEKAGWDRPAPAGVFRGVAVHKSFGTHVAQVAEISLKDDGGIKVERVVCAVDCGIAVNPDIVRAQMEGGIGYGLGAILKGEITLDGGRVVQGNFDEYQVLTIDEMPKVEVHIVPSTEPPTGVGEPGVPPIGPAMANAVFAATGKRIRILPFAKNDLRTA